MQNRNARVGQPDVVMAASTDRGHLWLERNDCSGDHDLDVGAFHDIPSAPEAAAPLHHDYPAHQRSNPGNSGSLPVTPVPGSLTDRARKYTFERADRS